MAIKSRSTERKRRHRRVRKKIFGTALCPRLNVFRSSRHITAQIIDDEKGNTITSASSLESGIIDQSKDITKTDEAKYIGAVVAARAQEKGITQVVFDRGGYKYHGRVKALAEAAREAGLQF